MPISYTPATKEDLENSWNREIAENPNDNRYIIWKEQFLRDNESGKCKTFFAKNDKEIIGQLTLILKTKDTAELNALRLYPQHQGKGIASELVKFAETWARQNGIKSLIIGVEPHETRNKEIYTHWGFTQFVESKQEKYPPKNTQDEGEVFTVMYYRKPL